MLPRDPSPRKRSRKHADLLRIHRSVPEQLHVDGHDPADCVDRGNVGGERRGVVAHSRLSPACAEEGELVPLRAVHKACEGNLREVVALAARVVLPDAVTRDGVLHALVQGN